VILYLDASALVKRYLEEEGSELVHEVMRAADAWVACRVGYVETVRAVALAAGRTAARRAADEWTAIEVIEVDGGLAERAAELAITHRLRTLDALHLAAALLAPPADLVLTTWDRQLHGAAKAAGLLLAPEHLS
jgi:predicted nucleic acid-binding protein